MKSRFIYKNSIRRTGKCLPRPSKIPLSPPASHSPGITFAYVGGSPQGRRRRRKELILWCPSLWVWRLWQAESEKTFLFIRERGVGFWQGELTGRIVFAKCHSRGRALRILPLFSKKNKGLGSIKSFLCAKSKGSGEKTIFFATCLMEKNL